MALVSESENKRRNIIASMGATLQPRLTFAVALPIDTGDNMKGTPYRAIPEELYRPEGLTFLEVTSTGPAIQTSQFKHVNEAMTATWQLSIRD